MQQLVRHHLTFDFGTSVMAKNLMKAMNVDPNTELVNLEKQFQYLRCDLDTISLMTWTALVNHFVQKESNLAQMKVKMTMHLMIFCL
ncbi:hypothetical protein M422DRAFT_239016 [Sphaerobolus stellatus SS14]|nr:hypothetical protein M422DRAFT_239016 [Sphaerobolus stellatus SS14]